MFSPLSLRVPLLWLLLLPKSLSVSVYAPFFSLSLRCCCVKKLSADGKAPPERAEPPHSIATTQMDRAFLNRCKETLCVCLCADNVWLRVALYISPSSPFGRKIQSTSIISSTLYPDSCLSTFSTYCCCSSCFFFPLCPAPSCPVSTTPCFRSDIRLATRSFPHHSDGHGVCLVYTPHLISFELLEIIKSVERRWIVLLLYVYFSRLYTNINARIDLTISISSPPPPKLDGCVSVLLYV